MTGQDFERSLVHAFNNYFADTGIRALAYRNKQYKYEEQVFDVLVDSRRNELYLAIECKSVQASSTPKLYWKKFFHVCKGISQIQVESERLVQTGRNGFLAIETRFGPGKASKCYFVPWRVVEHAFKSGLSGLTIAEVIQCVSLKKTKQGYTFDDNFMNELYSKLDGVNKAFTRYEIKGKVY